MSRLQYAAEGFVDLLRESVLVQSALTLMLVATACYLFVVGQPVPDLLRDAILLVLGFYFGSKSQHAVSQIRRLKE